MPLEEIYLCLAYAIFFSVLRPVPFKNKNKNKNLYLSRKELMKRKTE